MKNTKIIALVVFIVSIFFGCKKDENYIISAEVVKKFDKDLVGKVWKAVKFVQVENDAQGKEISHTTLDSKDAHITTIEFKNKLLYTESSLFGHLAYDVTNFGYGITVNLYIYEMTVKENSTSFFVCKLYQDYSEFRVLYLLRSDNKLYYTNYKLQ